MKTKISGDGLLYVSLFAISVGFSAIGIPYGINLPADNDGSVFDPSSPRFLAYCSTILVGLFAIIGFVGTFRAGARNTELTTRFGAVSLNEFLGLLLLLASLPLSYLIGLPLAGAVVGIGLLKLSGRAHLTSYAVVGLIFPLIVSGFFGLILSVPIPLGLF
ncbi:hypothetical protein [Hoeflea prorocentri]|uniref:Tripartite tricarboxylate transporter TctB family protein n=1 Tax=Hoeflea prorocentri TaxID=1922333 RepID=A0A9X3ZF97_9HYPH|nr:hypothetical protein [Hoeflea prorocentri]MCY6379406.1 hypothetical protein [Hoeflea prorocentri]MDA5397207.1 hypothetical protein [Hoeflea prorocentri]